LKNKNNDLVPQIFLAVVGVILVGIIVNYVMNSVHSTRKLADNILLDTQTAALDYSENDIVKYDKEEVRGAEVVNFIKKHLGDYPSSDIAPIYVETITKASTSNFTNKYTNNEYIDHIKNFSSIEYYIKPTALFTAEVIRTKNRVIVGVKFTQK